MTQELQELLKADVQITRDKLLRLQQEVERLPQFEPPVRHMVYGGMYAREMFIPAGAIVIGKVHLKDHLCKVLGDVSVYSPGVGVVRITGCHLLPAAAGAKRALVAHTDTWWTTIHCNPDNEADVPTLEARFVADGFEEFDLQMIRGH